MSGSGYSSERIPALTAGEGAEAVCDQELVGLVLERGDAGEIAELSERIFSTFSGRALSRVSPEEMAAHCGLTDREAGRLSASIELARRLLMPGDSKKPIRSPRDVCQYATWIKTAEKEYFLALYLNARNVLIHEETVSIGSLNANIVHPREVFRPAIVNSAAAVILVHNHPSGDISPSQEDLRLTARLVEAGRLIGIEVLDHLIITEKSFMSFRSEAYI